jgi:hypothetical protein
MSFGVKLLLGTKAIEQSSNMPCLASPMMEAETAFTVCGRMRCQREINAEVVLGIQVRHFERL